MFPENISGIILAGGQGKRMGGRDKGLVPLAGTPMIAQVIQRLQPQVGNLSINANRNLETYRQWGLPVIADALPDYPGPLAGIAASLQSINTEYALFVPCDSPFLPTDLCVRLWHELQQQQAVLCYAKDSQRQQPLFVLMRTDLVIHLSEYLNNGGRGVQRWYQELAATVCDFSGQTQAFRNINQPADL
ncbi:molybdenum cofactor guanylyltransferase MobA [Candidatus Venteria ishoeyi]|uniref:molybdenum cofactor guanylyltransferase MobA n=1 Tax=Candidatus Venteria ishoeyi TaxID=1899563 RepID=UPI0025A608CC|nr:molybdenum cofactor guanylyltransferase MobA [Candidatus Venteria ishoeyi]MDM8545089.1 molybdenum cofactor guanylyltransferase MobA [Candidatus Venteria ishoeyi]